MGSGTSVIRTNESLDEQIKKLSTEELETFLDHISESNRKRLTEVLLRKSKVVEQANNAVVEPTTNQLRMSPPRERGGRKSLTNAMSANIASALADTTDDPPGVGESSQYATKARRTSLTRERGGRKSLTNAMSANIASALADTTDDPPGIEDAPESRE